MKTCILTVIKNEQDYLSEWISYHLNIGISHIFIFEDIDSDSHKYITDQYGDKVTLANVSSILNDDDLKRAKKYKATKWRSPQRTFLYEGMLYIKNNFSYDWCFVIDNDEFITLEEQNNLEDILSMYSNYDALLLSWKCFGANGIVYKPDYTNKGVVDTFTTPIQGRIPITNPTYDKKTCYNLNKYGTDFWNDTHTPSENCNYCNTVFEKDKNRLVYNEIYIRHYVTKSWEEYVWKKTVRGYFMGFARSFDAFFKMNPDMLTMKENLLSMVDDEVLVVLPYSQNGSQGNEIRLALSCWRKYCKSKYHFVVIGDFDESIKEQFDWVEFVYEPRVGKKEGQYNPHIDIQHKMEIAYNLYGDKYPGFIWMVDDNYAIKPFYTYEIKNLYYHEQGFVGKEQAPTYHWKHDKWKTRQLLDREVLPHINYTTHFPCYFEFRRLKRIWDKYNMREESYVIEDIYFNFYPHTNPTIDNAIRLGIWDTNNTDQKIKSAYYNPNIKFVCNSTEGWSKELEMALWSIVKEEYE